MPPLTIAIAGAGIGGLAAALALSLKGHDVTMVEARTGFGEPGAGLQLSPNASRVLIEMGLGPALRRASIEPERVVIYQLKSGRVLGAMAVKGFMEKRHGAPYYALARADLQTLLLDAVRSQAKIRLLMGRRVTGLEQDKTGIRLALTGSSGTADILKADLAIGADGIHSVLRQLIDKTPLLYQGYAAWRTVIERSQVPEPFATSETGLWLGASGHIVHYPIGDDRLNIVAIMRRPEPVEGWSELGNERELLHVFNHASPVLKTLLQAAPEWRIWSLFDRHVGAMAKGRLALLGDAAHPVLPFLAQGAALAIEDVAVLAQALEQHPVEQALKLYARQRLPRGRRIQQAGRRNGPLYHATGLKALARNLMLRRLGPERMAQRYDWIYGWHVE